MDTYKIRVGNLYVKHAFTLKSNEETIIKLTSEITKAEIIRDKDEAISKGKLCKRELGGYVRIDVVSEQVVSEVLIEEESK